MLKLYLNTEEPTLEDMLLNASEHNSLHFICNDDVDDIDETKIELGQNYGYRVHYGFSFFPAMKERVYELLDDRDDHTICIDNINNWMLGIDSEANSLEYMYTENTIDELKEFIYRLLQGTSKHDISILCNEYMLQYLIDTLHMNHYVIID